jgi:hypothetical protein
VPNIIFILYLKIILYCGMFVRVKTSPNSPKKAVQIVENLRDGDKVKQRIVRHVGTALMMKN